MLVQLARSSTCFWIQVRRLCGSKVRHASQLSVRVKSVTSRASRRASKIQALHSRSSMVSVRLLDIWSPIRWLGRLTPSHIKLQMMCPFYLSSKQKTWIHLIKMGWLVWLQARSMRNKTQGKSHWFGQCMNKANYVTWCSVCIWVIVMMMKARFGSVALTAQLSVGWLHVTNKINKQSRWAMNS